jgi:hypothetical protein
MPLIESVALPVLLTITVCAALATFTVAVKLSGPVGARVTAGAVAAVPVPFSVTVCGEPDALSAIEMAAVQPVAAAGVNVTEIEHCALTASVAPHVVV